MHNYLYIFIIKVYIEIISVSDFKRNEKTKIYKYRTTFNDSTKDKDTKIRNWESYKSFSIYKYLALIYEIWITTYKFHCIWLESFVKRWHILLQCNQTMFEFSVNYWLFFINYYIYFLFVTFFYAIKIFSYKNFSYKNS